MEDYPKTQGNDFLHRATAIRSLIKAGGDLPKQYDLSSLRLLGTVGEPINPEAWMWYKDTVGGGRCPIVDTWWQTETGSIMIAPLPGATMTKPGSCTLPLPGIFPAVIDENGNEAKSGQGGYLVLQKPWPSHLRTIWGDDERYVQTYYPATVANGKYYVAGDSANRDEDGYFWIMGRIDDVLNVSGHRLGTMEIESALVANPKSPKPPLFGRPDDITARRFALLWCYMATVRKARRRTNWENNCVIGSAKKLAPSPNRKKFASATICLRQEAVKSCAVYYATSPKGRTLRRILQHWKTRHFRATKRIQLMRLIVVGVIVLALNWTTGQAAAYDFPQTEKYKKGLNLADYYVTKSPVGLPAHWDGEKLIDDKGGTYQTPDWFIEHFPPNALDGVLSGKDIETIRRVAYRRDAQNAWQRLRLYRI